MTNHTRHAFSLIELVVIIAVIAAMATIIVPTISIFTETSKDITEERSIQLWNNTYLQLLAADPSQKGTAWESMSTDLANGIAIEIASDNLIYQAPIPDFINSGSPEFTPGTGITNAP